MTTSRCTVPPSIEVFRLPLDQRWSTEVVVALARGIATEVALDRLPILADALEEAGCDHDDLLRHLRADTAHWAGCWALRTVLRTSVPLPGGREMLFNWCPPGAFQMGSPMAEQSRGEDELLHTVRLTHGFWCGMHPVTQAEWRAVMGTDPSMFSEELLGPDAGGGWDDRPVESVSWDDADEFCDRLKEASGVQVRLPTEAEWEYACRGGTTTPFYWGATADGSQANCDGTAPYGTVTAGNNLRQTSPVGRYAAVHPHPWGLTDVHGNVLEWCADWYDPDYSSRSPADDPECRDGEKTRRVLRGGCWANHPALCRSAKRWMLPRGIPAQFQSGFRVVFRDA